MGVAPTNWSERQILKLAAIKTQVRVDTKYFGVIVLICGTADGKNVREFCDVVVAILFFWLI